MKILKQATGIRHVLAKLSKFVQIGQQVSSDSFYRGFFPGHRTSFQAAFFIKFFDKKFSFLVMLHKLAEFHHQTVFNS